MHVLRTIILLVSLNGVVATADAQDTLFWHSWRPLQWSDFKGEPNFSLLYRMLSSTGLKYGYKKSKQNFQFEVSAFFLPHRSWKKHISDSSLLQHEQLHFDITELYARKLLKELQLLNPYDPLLDTKVDAIAMKIIAEKNLVQDTYDKATQFGANKKTQRHWEADIKKKLLQALR